MEKVIIANRFDKVERERARKFLSRFALRYEDNIDKTINIYIDKILVATGSKTLNIFKCFAIDESVQGKGVLNQLVTYLQKECEKEGIFHYFLFTKVNTISVFSNTFFKEIISTDKVALLEGGISSIHDFINKKKSEICTNEKKERAVIVMNCNPFTKGHRFLIEYAAKENEEVIVFVLEEDLSIFNTQSRLKMVRDGVKDLANVKVVLSGEYIISQKTFPTYFLKEKSNELKIYTDLDISLFAKYFCSPFKIVKRYVGTEPICDVTKTYNESMKNIFPRFGVEVREINRLEIDGVVVSATYIRKWLKEENINFLEKYLPQSTLDFLKSPEGKKCVEKIQNS